MRKANIYVLVDPRSGEVRYVGQSIEPVTRRRLHMIEAQHGQPNHMKCRWLNELRDLGLMPELYIVDKVSQVKSKSVEIKWIHHFDLIDASLTNIHHSRRVKRVVAEQYVFNQLDELAEKSNKSPSEIISIAIDKFYHQQKAHGTQPSTGHK